MRSGGKDSDLLGLELSPVEYTLPKAYAKVYTSLKDGLIEQ
jgi:hypothetical protein